MAGNLEMCGNSIWVTRDVYTVSLSTETDPYLNLYLMKILFIWCKYSGQDQYVKMEIGFSTSSKYMEYCNSAPSFLSQQDIARMRRLC